MPERGRNMDYKEFREKILEELEDFYGKDALVKIHKIYKNNGVVKYGVVTRFTDGNSSSAVPVIYLEELYRCYSEGSITIEECIGKVIDKREESRNNQEYVMGMSVNIMEWEYARHNIYPVFLPKESNREMLKNLITTDMLDLVIVYIIRGKAEDGSFTSIKINRFLLGQYGISRESLHKQALSNIKKDGYRFYGIAGALESFIENGSFSASCTREESITPQGLMYIMTNSAAFYGTAGILDSGWLHGRTGGNSCYIIPSSVHELLFIPDNGQANQDELDRMVQEINSLEVAEDERLSWHCYYYDAATGEIRTRK